MFDTDPAAWRISTWALYGLAAVYVVGFVAFWLAFGVAERRARRHGGDAVLAYNALLRGFPNALYAKMFGKQPFETPPVGPRPPQ